MAMRSATSPRRIYVRNGSPVVCYGGVYFAPKADSLVNLEREVRIELLPVSGGKKRIQVTQKHGKNPATVETWKELEIVRVPRGSKASASEPTVSEAPAPEAPPAA